jgi:hypothetical protein
LGCEGSAHIPFSAIIILGTPALKEFLMLQFSAGQELRWMEVQNQALVAFIIVVMFTNQAIAIVTLKKCDPIEVPRSLKTPIRC